MIHATTWLCMSIDEDRLRVRATHVERPTLQPGEIALQLDLDVPRRLFEQPMLHASLTVSDQDYEVAALCQTIERAVLRQVGLSVRVQESPF